MNYLLRMALAGLVIGMMSCSETDDGGVPPGLDGDSDTDADTDADTDSDTDVDVDTALDPDGDGIVDDPSAISTNCNNVLPVTFRDFGSAHPDFEIPIAPPPNDLWPNYVVLHIVADTLGPDKKPVFNTGDEACWVTGSNCFSMQTQWNPSIPNPMPVAFNDWYNDLPNINVRIDKGIILTDQGNGTSVFDSARFFPIGLTEGFGAEAGQLDDDGVQHNFLFTTEIHTAFEYVGGELFSFRGDDDLWIFVNGRLAMDLGGLHEPRDGVIDFDAMATQLGITPGNTYDLDIFHAERHTKASNFRVETTIECFVPPIE